jgi:hypothetical protein
VVLTPASSIQVRPVRWLWADRIPLGALTLCAGREGIGKSTLAYSLAAAITRGSLPGACCGAPRAILVAATEDSWAHTVVPRLMAAGADLDRIFRVDVEVDSTSGELVLPQDIEALEQHIKAQNVSLVLLDPLVSRLNGTLDTHKDSQVRQGLEPLTALADRSGVAVLGLVHVNKGFSADPLNLIIGSRAFTAVARAVVFVMIDPEDNSRRLVGVPKSNLGRTDLPTLMFEIGGVTVAETDEGPVRTGQLMWTGETDRTLHDVLQGVEGQSKHQSAVGNAAKWLEVYLAEQGGGAERSAIETAGKTAGHSIDAIKRARNKIGVQTTSHGFPRRTYWTLPPNESRPGRPSQSEQSCPDHNAALTAPTAPTATTTSTPTLHPTGLIGVDPAQSEQWAQSAVSAEPAA